MAASDVLPRFFSVFLSHYSSESLLIPSSYYEHLPRRLPKTAILMGSGGRIWKVAMISKREQVYFDKGWASFVADNKIKDGEFLTFVFDGVQTYEVSIYGHGDCKETRAAIQVEEISDGTESDDSLDEVIDITTIQEEEISDEAENESDYSPNSLDIATSKNREKKTIGNPEAHLDDPNNLHFVTSLKNRKYELLFDARLIKDYDLKFGTSVDLIDKHGKLTAKRVSWADKRVCIKRWKSICDRNNLKNNDSILCEILRTSSNVVYAIKIHIISG